MRLIGRANQHTYKRIINWLPFMKRVYKYDDIIFLCWTFYFNSSFAAGRYVARKIASVFSRSDRQAQRSLKALDQSAGSMSGSQKYASAAADINDSQASAKEQKQTGFSNGTANHVNKEGTARQRVSWLFNGLANLQTTSCLLGNNRKKSFGIQTRFFYW